MSKYMFFDDLHLAEKSNCVVRTVQPGRGFTALKADREWERCGLCGDPCMTLLDDDGVIKLYYTIVSPDAAQGSRRELSASERASLDLEHIDAKFLADILCPERYYLCYAYSTDGRNWVKPDLGIYEVDGSKHNNIVWGGRIGATVFVDPTAPAESRYKMIHGGSLKLPHWMNGKFIRMAYTGIYGAVSSDGIHWRNSDKPIMPHYTDTTNVCFYDDEQQKYIAFVRTDKNMIYDNGKTVMTDPEHRTYRIISRSESRDFFNFPPPETVMEPAAEDCQDYHSHWQCKAGMDFYNPAAMKYPAASGVYFLFPSSFHHDTDEAIIRIAAGRDSKNFTRNDQILIPPEAAPAFRAQQQYLACGMLSGADDSLTVYAHACSVGHDALGAAAERRHEIVGYTFQTDGFLGQYSRGGSLTTHYLDVPENCRTVKLRAQINAGGQLQPVLLDENSQTLDVQFVRQAAANCGTILQAVLPEQVKRIKLQMQIVEATVFSLEFL